MRNPLANLTDQELIASLKALVKDERRRTVDILKHLNEMDRRSVAERVGFPSLFEYCVRELRYIRGTSARIIHAARAAKKYGILYRAMERGLLSVTTVSLLAPHLKWENHRRLVREASGKSAREVEALVAALNPVLAAPAERIRFLAVAVPAAAPVETEDLFVPSANVEPPVHPVPILPCAAAAEALVVPASPPAPDSPAVPVATVAAAVQAAPMPPVVQRVHFSFTGDEALFRDVERVKALSRHRWPGGHLEDVFAGAIRALLAKIDPDIRSRRRERARRLSAGARSRNIARAVKDEVWIRDGGKCAYKTPEGKTCGARAGLEYDHIRPWALGGSSEDACNVRLLCRAHNVLEARRVLGDAVIDAAVARRRGALRGGAKI
jgi:5-methylcytosine-specific restriction endonuclease McrA